MKRKGMYLRPVPVRMSRHEGVHDTRDPGLMHQDGKVLGLLNHTQDSFQSPYVRLFLSRCDE